MINIFNTSKITGEKNRYFKSEKKLRELIQRLKEINAMETSLWNLIQDNTKPAIPVILEKMKEMVKTEIEDIKSIDENIKKLNVDLDYDKNKLDDTEFQKTHATQQQLMTSEILNLTETLKSLNELHDLLATQINELMDITNKNDQEIIVVLDGKKQELSQSSHLIKNLIDDINKKLSTLDSSYIQLSKTQQEETYNRKDAQTNELENAIINQDIKQIEEIINKNKNLSINDALITACENKSAEVAKLLMLKYHADPNYMQKYQLPTDNYVEYKTPLEIAIRNKDIELGQLLLQQPNINLNLGDNKNYFTLACYNNVIEIEQLIYSHPGFNINKMYHDPNYGTTTILKEVIRQKKTDLAMYILDRPNLDFPSEEGVEILIQAVESKSLPLVQKLIQKLHNKIDINKGDRFGHTAIKTAKIKGYKEIYNYLTSLAEYNKESHKLTDQDLKGVGFFKKLFLK